VAFQTAYLKANYPSEYMAAVLSRNLNDISKLSVFMDECKAMKIQVLGPDVNESFSSFGVNKQGDIRFGLSAIKGVGINVVSEILKARGDKPFADIFDFVERVPTGVINRRTLENLAVAGAFDCFHEMKREDFFQVNSRDETFSEQILKYGMRYQHNKEDQTASLFGFDETAAMNIQARPAVKPAMQWDNIIRLDKERELVGMYLSAHPLDPYYMELTYATGSTISGLTEIEPKEDKEVTFGGMVIDYQTKPTKKGGLFGIMKIEDYTGTTEVRLFGQKVYDLGRYGIPGTPVLVTCRYQRQYRTGELNFDTVNIQPLDMLTDKLIKGISISVTANQANKFTAELLSEYIKSPKGHLGSLNFSIFDSSINRTVKLSSSARISINRELINMLEENGIDFTIETA
jgi:DNA polymerase-3 subunit alpha